MRSGGSPSGRPSALAFPNRVIARPSNQAKALFRTPDVFACRNLDCFLDSEVGYAVDQTSGKTAAADGRLVFGIRIRVEEKIPGLKRAKGERGSQPQVRSDESQNFVFGILHDPSLRALYLSTFLPLRMSVVTVQKRSSSFNGPLFLLPRGMALRHHIIT